MTRDADNGRRKIDHVFGEDLPQASSDERGDERDVRSSEYDSDRDGWLRQNVPPHHG